MSQHSKEQQLVTFNYIRTNYEEKINHENVPDAIKYLVFSFATKIIPSKILTIKQDLDFYQKLKNILNFNIEKLVLKFRGSENKFSAEKFHEICGNNSKPFPNITLFKSNNGNIFGGFTRLAWNKNGSQFRQDDDACLFVVSSDDKDTDKRCPIIIDNKKKNRIAVCCKDKNFVIYCDGFDIRIGNDCSDENQGWEFDLIEGDFVNAYIRPSGIKYKFDSLNWFRLDCYVNAEQENLNVRNVCGGTESGSNFFDVKFNFLDIVEFEVFELLLKV